MSLVRPAIYYWIFLLALLVYVITAYNSHGFYYADEHFQIIEFAKLKCDLNTIQDMPWEYKEQLRSTIQPLLCLLIFKFCNLVHITNPYNFGFVLRLLSAFFALFTIHYFIIYTAYLIHSEHAKIAYYLFSYFIWFIPFISVHFSSENMGGLCFLTSLTIFFNPFIQQKKNFFMGCLMGLSFLFRFQMIFAVLGLVLWLVLVGKISFKNVMHLLSGFLLVISIGILIDCWFYEKPVLTAWNYFYAFYDNTVNDVVKQRLEVALARSRQRHADLRHPR
ncbi:MAG TPA: hypothetical protein VLB84_20305, partial [Bacteroidia bacterium]|nr:hypothetical protein [Bacteroidia bacterium]